MSLIFRKEVDDLMFYRVICYIIRNICYIFLISLKLYLFLLFISNDTNNLILTNKNQQL
jgi:hypothetical protein